MMNTINELVKSAYSKHPDDVDVIEYAKMVKKCSYKHEQPFLALKKCISFINTQEFNIAGYFLSNIVDSTANGIDIVPNSWLFTFINDCTQEDKSGLFYIEVNDNGKKLTADTWPNSTPLGKSIQSIS